MGHADGICHIYVDRDFDIEKAVPIIIDAKTQYTAACNSVETLLIHKDAVDCLMPKLIKAFQEHHIELRALLKLQINTTVSLQKTKILPQNTLT